MTLPKFELHRPESLDEALDILASSPGAVPIAGGTALIVDMRGRRLSPPVLVDIGLIDRLSGVRIEGGEVVIGAATTIAEIKESDLIAQHSPLLSEACGLFASPSVRNRATIGGNIAYASPAADTAPPLLALDASVELASASGRRTVPIDRFFLGVRRTETRDDELITAIRFPIPAEGTEGRFRKLGLRRADAISVVSAAVSIGPPADGGRRVRIALGAVAPTPIRARRAEEALSAGPIDEGAILAAAEAAASEASPVSDLRGSDWYRREAIRALVRRLLRPVVEGRSDG